MLRYNNDLLGRLSRFFPTVDTKRTLELSADASRNEKVQAEFNRISFMMGRVDESTMQQAVDMFNQSGSGFTLTYAIQTEEKATTEPSNIKQLLAAQKLAQKLELTDAFNSACEEADATNKIEPFNRFLEKLLATYKAWWMKENQNRVEEGLSKISEEGKRALEEANHERFLELVKDTMIRPMFSDYWAELSRAGLNLSEQDLAKMVASSIQHPTVKAQMESEINEYMAARFTR